MPRTKGSKNVKTLELEAQADQLLEAEKTKMLRLTDEQSQLEQEIEEKKLHLKLKRKELRRTAREIDKLTSIVIENAKTATERELYELVASLIESGRTADDILEEFQA